MDSVPEPAIPEFATLPTGYPNGVCFDRTERLYCADSLGDVVVFEPDGSVAEVVEMGAGTEPTNCCLGDGVLYVALAGPGQPATPIAAEPLPLYPARRSHHFRRSRMHRLAAAAVLALLLLARSSNADEPAPPPSADVQTAASQAATTPAQALAWLREGNARFVANTPKPRNWPAKVAATAGGQYPFAAILGCMDSRVPVEIAFDQGLGDIFAVRVAGNVVNEDELGSLEYAVKVGAKLLVVLGHTACGAVKGAIDDVQMGSLTGLLAKIRPAVATAHCSDTKDAACVDAVAKANVFQSMGEIRRRSAYLSKALDDGQIDLAGAIYDVATGRVTFLDRRASGG